MLGNAKAISLLSMIICSPYVLCHTMNDAKRLLADKLSGYEKTFRPVVNQSAPVDVYAALEIISIQEFDEVQEKLTIAAVVFLNWIDEYMTWDSDDYGGLKELVIESEKVWTPNIVLANNFNKMNKVGDTWQVIRFTSKGVAFYYPGNVFSASCKVDVTYYPWDRHDCVFSFSVWGISSSEVLFRPHANKVVTSYFSDNGEWTLMDSSVTDYSNFSFLDFHLHLERKPRFVLVNVILPIIFLAFLNAMIFAIPVESGERISCSITVMLALAVFLTLVGDNLPKTSSPMSLFSYYLVTVLVVSIFITLATIFNVRLYYTDDPEPVSGCWASFTQCMKCRCSRRKYERRKKYIRERSRHFDQINGLNGTKQTVEILRNQTNISTVHIHKGPAFPGTNEQLPKSYNNHDLSETGLYKAGSDERDSRQPEKEENINVDMCLSWKDVSAAFDKIFFAMAIIALTVATTIFFMFTCRRD